MIASVPVLSAIPKSQQALSLYQAMRALTTQPGFVRLERARARDLQTT